MKIEILNNTPQHIDTCVDHLAQDGLIGFPTETVYGLGARADHAPAVAKIFQLKGRPANHPLIVHLAPASDSSDLAWLDLLTPWARDISPQAIALAKAFWPGPMTMILQKAKGVIDEVTGGHATIGLRCPDSAPAIQILQQLGTGIAAPSANRFGAISPTSARHVYDAFAGQIDQYSTAFDVFILDAGICDVGIESTIIDLSQLAMLGPLLLRPGMITAKEIARKTGLHIGKIEHHQVAHSGSLAAHYAPKTRLSMVSQPLATFHFPSNEKSIWVSMADEDINYRCDQKVQQISKDPLAVAKMIYALLHSLDAQGYDHLYFRELPNIPEWEGIRDRLNRAATGSGQT